MTTPRTSRTPRCIALTLAAGIALTLGVGCAGVNKDSKTMGAEKLAEGHGELMATADHAGQIQVWDNDTDKIIYQAQVHHGDKVAVDPADNKITVNGDTVAEPPLMRDHRYQIYLKR